MNDDFLSDIDNAVDGTETPEPVTTDVKEPEKLADTSIQEELLDLTASDEEKAATKKRETLSIKKPEEADGEDTSKEAKETADKEKAATSKETSHTGPEKAGDAAKREAIPYLDRYLAEDKQGNLTLADGTIVATAGAARTYYENVKKEGREARKAAEQMAIANAQLGQKFRELHRDFERMKTSDEMKSLTERTGMSNTEINRAVAMMKAIKDDPLEGIKKVLTQARMDGIDLSSLGVQGGFDVSVIKDTIQDIMKQNAAPVTTDVSEEELQQSVEAEAKDFLGRNPQAEPFAAILGQAKRRFPNKTLDELWVGLQNARRNKLEQSQKEAFEKSVTNDVKRTEQTPSPGRRQKIAPPSRNFATMSYEDIANSIQEDYS